MQKQIAALVGAVTLSYLGYSTFVGSEIEENEELEREKTAFKVVSSRKFKMPSEETFTRWKIGKAFAFLHF